MANSYNTAYQQTPDINSTSNYNTTSTVKSENSWCLVASQLNTQADSFVQNYMAITFDAVMSTDVKRQAQVTSYAVESGAQIADHVQLRNSTFSMQGMVTETPIPRKGMLDMLATVTKGSRVSACIDYLNQIFEARQPITLLTEHKVIDNVILKGIDYAYKSEDAMIFNLEFEQVRLVGGATTNTIATKTQGTKYGGKKTKTRVENAGSNSGNITNPASTLQPTLDTAK